MEKVIEIKNLTKTFRLSNRQLPFTKRLLRLFDFREGRKMIALDNINLEIYKGDSLGIIGHNGSGKSTLLKLIIGAIEADQGSYIKTNGKIIRLALGMGFDNNLSARDNIYLNGTILGLTFIQIGEKFDEIIAFSELEDFIDTPLKFYSSGMRSRLSFAIAIHAEADIFLIDEFFGDVGDEMFKQKSQKAFENNLLKGKTIIHVSHSLELLLKQCDRIFVIEKGKGRLYNNPIDAINDYKKNRLNLSKFEG